MKDFFFQYLIEHIEKKNFKEVVIKTKQNLDKYSHIPQFWNLRGIALENLGYSSESIKCFLKCFDLDKKNFAALDNIAKVFFDKKNFLKSIEFSLQSLEVKTNNLNALINLMNAYFSLEMYNECIKIIEKILNNHSSNVNLSLIYNFKGCCYESLQEIDLAIKNYNLAIEENSKFVPAMLNLANCYSTLGKMDVAKIQYQKLLNEKPDMSDVHRRLSIITKYKEDDDPHIRQMEKIFSQFINDEEKIEELGYALSKSKEDVKNFKEAFHYMSISNAIRDKKTNYNFQFQEEEYECLKNIFNNQKNDLTKYIKTIPDNAIFILGMPRSGTTLVEQIISSHPKVQGLEEIDYLSKSLSECVPHKSLEEFYNKIINNSDIFKCIESKYFEKINNKKNSLYLLHTDKMPVNYKLIGFIKHAMPYAKIIHCVRDPKDIFVSIFKNYFGKLQMSYAYNSAKLIHTLNLYVDYMHFWKKIYGDWIYDLKYENLVSNTDSEIKKLLTFCDLSFSPECLNFENNQKSVSTASSFQVRQPIYKTSNNAWKNYEPYLKDEFKKLKIY